jgi:dephospho-CoA kinase
MKRIRVIGLTGGVGCGKSTVAQILIRLGVPVLDTDAVAHELLKPGSPVLERVISEFGEMYRDGDGLDRRKLGQRVFADRDALRRLNALMHPEVFRQMHLWLEQTLTGHEQAVVMIPLLFETGAERWCDTVVTVAADEKLVLERLVGRGWTEAEARARMAAQLPLAEKVSRADVVIWNNEGLDALSQATMKFWNTMQCGKEAEQ